MLKLKHSSDSALLIFAACLSWMPLFYISAIVVLQSADVVLVASLFPKSSQLANTWTNNRFVHLRHVPWEYRRDYYAASLPQTTSPSTERRGQEAGQFSFIPWFPTYFIQWFPTYFIPWFPTYFRRPDNSHSLNNFLLISVFLSCFR